MSPQFAKIIAQAVLTGEIHVSDDAIELPRLVTLYNDPEQPRIVLKFPQDKPRWNGKLVPVNSLTFTANDEYLTIHPDVPFLPGFAEPAIRIRL